MKLLLTLSYLGTDFCGFQAQANGRTVQTVLTEAAERTFGFPCHITGCSRTDSGVHALHFCATLAPAEGAFDGWCSIPTSKVPRAMNQHLPTDVSVLSAEEREDTFHPRYDVLKKQYLYLVRAGGERDPFTAGREYHFRRAFPEGALARMQQAAAHMTGTHDFSSFMAAGSKITDAVRTVYTADVTEEDGRLAFRFSADGFLYNMVRIMVGTLLDVGVGKTAPDAIPAIIEARDRDCAGATAPPEGLYLEHVYYRED